MRLITFGWLALLSTFNYFIFDLVTALMVGLTISGYLLLESKEKDWKLRKEVKEG